MAKPPESPPSSDIGGVHRDGMRPSKPLPAEDKGSGKALKRAAEEDVGRPPYSEKESKDERTG